MRSAVPVVFLALEAGSCSDSVSPEPSALPDDEAEHTSPTSIEIPDEPEFSPPPGSPLDLGGPPPGMAWLDPVAVPGTISPLVADRATLPVCPSNGLDEWVRGRFDGIRDLPPEPMEIVDLLDVATCTPVLVAAGDPPVCVTARRSDGLGGWEMQAADGSLIARAASIESEFREPDRPKFEGFNFGSSAFGSGQWGSGVSLLSAFASSVRPQDDGPERLLIAETPFAVLTDVFSVTAERQTGWFSAAQLLPAFHSYGSQLPRHVGQGTARCLGPVSGPDELHSERQLLCDDRGVVLEVLRFNRRPDRLPAESYDRTITWDESADGLVATVRVPNDRLEYRFAAGIDRDTAEAMLLSVPTLDEAVWRPTQTATRPAAQLNPAQIATILEAAGAHDVAAAWQPVMMFCQLECFDTLPEQIVEATGSVVAVGELEVAVTKVDPGEPVWFADTMLIRHVGGIEVFGSTTPRLTSDTHSRCGDVGIRVLVRRETGEAGVHLLDPVMDIHAILADQLGC